MTMVRPRRIVEFYPSAGLDSATVTVLIFFRNTPLRLMY
jgi:hypothetical protein